MNTREEIIKQKWKTIISKTHSSFLINIKNERIPKHPLVIFYNEDDETIYYLSGQKYDSLKHDYLIDENKYCKVEVLDNSDPNQFIFHNTIIDTTLIHVCSLDEFISKFELNEKLNYYLIPTNERWEILSSLYKNHFENDIVAIKEIKIQNNKLVQEFIYLPEKNLDYQLKSYRLDYSHLSFNDKMQKLNLKFSDLNVEDDYLKGILTESIIIFLDEVNDNEYDKKMKQFIWKISKSQYFIKFKRKIKINQQNML